MTNTEIYDLLSKACGTNLTTNDFDESYCYRVGRSYNTLQYHNNIKRDLTQTTINIDNNIINVDYKDYHSLGKTDCMRFFYFTMKDHSIKSDFCMLTFSLYLPYDSAINNKVFYTTSKIERRLIKIDYLKNKNKEQ